MRNLRLFFFLLIVPIFLSSMGEKPGASNPVQLSTDKDVYIQGEQVKMNVKFTNTGSSDISSYYPSAQKFDFIAKDSSKKEIWSWARGKMFTMAIVPFQLKKGQSVIYSSSWDQRDMQRNKVAPGKYYVSGMIKIREGSSSAEKEIVIK